MQFKKAKIISEYDTIAEMLRLARQKKKLKIKDVAKKLNIKTAYLEALEKGDFNNLPGGIYAKNFLREYAYFLNLDGDKFAKIFVEETKNFSKPDQSAMFARSKIKKIDLVMAPKILRNIFLLLAVGLCLVYLGYALDRVTKKPEMVIVYPPENLATSEHQIEISGITESEVNLTINNEPLIADKEGKFYQKINLKEGVNIIDIVAKKKYSRANIISRKILVNSQ
jgi:cytoskeletal protein RodZ